MLFRSRWNICDDNDGGDGNRTRCFKKRKEVKQLMRILKRFFATLCVVIVIIFVLYFWFHIDTVKIEGGSVYSDIEIEKSVFCRKFSDNALVFRVYNKLYGINKLPFVEDIDVKYESHDTVVLHIYDKKISGCIKYMGQYVYFDKDGIVQIGRASCRERV